MVYACSALNIHFAVSTIFNQSHNDGGNNWNSIPIFVLWSIGIQLSYESYPIQVLIYRPKKNIKIQLSYPIQTLHLL